MHLQLKAVCRGSLTPPSMKRRGKEEDVWNSRCPDGNTCPQPGPHLPRSALCTLSSCLTLHAPRSVLLALSSVLRALYSVLRLHAPLGWRR